MNLKSTVAKHLTLRSFLNYTRRTPWLFRTVIVVCLVVWPFLYAASCIAEAWSNKEFTAFYRDVYRAFVEGKPV